MPTPFLRNRGTLTGSNSSTLTLPLSGTTQVGDLVVVYNENYTYGVGTNTASPAVPAGFVELYNSTSSTGHKQILYAKATDSGFGSSIKLTARPGMVTGQSWWGYADTFGDVSWRTPGWLALPGGLGNHMTYTRADVAARTTHTFAVRVRFDTLGVAQWMIGWNTGDAGFGLNASNQPIIFIKNTLGNIIGNFPPASAVPGLTVDQRVWLMGTVIASSAQCLYYYSYDDVEDYYSVHWTSMGFATGTNPATTMRVTNSDTVYVGTRDAATAAMAGRIYSYAELATDLTLSGTFSDPLPGAATVVGAADHVRPTDDNGNGSPIEDWGIGTFALFVDDLYAPGRRAHGTERLWYNAWLGNSATNVNQPITGPLDWQVYPDRTVLTQTRYSKAVTRTRPVDVEGAYPDEPASLGVPYNFGVLSLMIRGTLPVVYLPPGPQSEHLRLGCAESYAVWITDETYTRTLEQVRWSDIQWGRVLDDISQASVTIPDELGGVHCVARYGGLEPWAYGLYLERDDREVWSGPIVNVRRNGTDITVSAADVFARYQKRFVARQPAAFEETDAGEAFRQIIEQHAHLDSDAWTLPVPGCFVNVPITRALKPREFKYAWDLIAELFDTAIDAYIANGVLYMFEPMHGWCYYDNRTRTLPGPYNTNYDFVYGTFTEEAWTTRPDWSIDGAGQANFCVVPAADSGEQGFRSYEWAENVESQARYGVLDTVDPESLGIPDDSPPAVVTQALRSRAQTINALRAIPPIVVEGGVLSENAPIDVDNLRPGSLWKMDVYDAGYGHLLTVGRLRRVNVSVSMSDSGLVEKVSATLYPPGWEGENV